MKRKSWFAGAVASLVVGSVVWLVEGSALLQEGRGTVAVTAEGAPAAGVDVFALINGGKQPMGTTGAGGTLGFDPALLTGKVRVQVAVRECPDAREVYFVSPDTDEACRDVESASEEDDCRCDELGAIWWGDDLRVDVVGLTASGGGAPLTSNPVFWGGVAGAGAGTAIVVGSGGENGATTTTTPVGMVTTTSTTSAPPTTTSSAPVSLSGRYGINVTGVNDPGGHRQFTGDPPRTIDIEANGVFQADGAPPWVRVNGTIDSTGAFRATGRGNVAGRSGVMVLFEGTIGTSSPYPLMGTYRMGTNGELPGGQSIDFLLDGRKQ